VQGGRLLRHILAGELVSRAPYQILEGLAGPKSAVTALLSRGLYCGAHLAMKGEDSRSLHVGIARERGVHPDPSRLAGQYAGRDIEAGRLSAPSMLLPGLQTSAAHSIRAPRPCESRAR